MITQPRQQLRADTFFVASLAITTVVRAILAAVVPLTGDEAYFVLWGEHLDVGYYDHTPMVGWWLSAMLLLGKTVWLMRLPALLTTVAVALLIWRVARGLDREKGGWVAALYLWSPHNVLNFFTTTDTPLLFFSAFAGLWLFRAVRSDRALDYLLAGVCLGLAFLSKYFAVLLGLAAGVLLILFAGRPRWRGLALVAAGVLPCAALNVLWNYEHGWTNILFNLFNRTRDASFSLSSILSFLAITVLPIGPIAWYLLRRGVEGRSTWREAWARWRASGAVAFVLAFAVPMGLLLVVSFRKSVGAHWTLSFFPFLFIALVGLFSAEALRRMTRPMVIFGSVLCLVAAVLVTLPVELMRGHKSYDSVVLGTHMDEVLEKLQPYRDEYMLTTPSYAKSAILTFFADAYVPVIGPGSYHGRQDDLITNLSDFEGRKIMVLCDREDRVAMAQPWFERNEVKQVEVRGARFWVVLGQGFRFREYRNDVITQLAQRYYSMPWWLASWSKPSFFYVRYGLPLADATRQPLPAALPHKRSGQGALN